MLDVPIGGVVVCATLKAAKTDTVAKAAARRTEVNPAKKVENAKRVFAMLNMIHSSGTVVLLRVVYALPDAGCAGGCGSISVSGLRAFSQNLLYAETASLW